MTRPPITTNNAEPCTFNIIKPSNFTVKQISKQDLEGCTPSPNVSMSKKATEEMVKMALSLRTTVPDLLQAATRYVRATGANISAPELLQAAGTYIQHNPGQFAVQAVGTVAAVAAVATVPILGAVGFTASGPAVGSVAAGWQASIGVVQAGSAFAWCQSAAMGGAAVGGVTTVGAAGGLTALVATIPQLVPGWGDSLWGLFRRNGP